MRHALGIMGVLAAGVLLAVSAAMNWRFGYTLGKTEIDGQIYGAASVAADCLKALVPFFFFAALRNKMWSQAAASALVWVVVTGYSLTSAVGHAMLNRLDTASQRTIEVSSYGDLRADLKRAQEQLSWIPQHRPANAVGGEMEGLKSQRLWSATAGCTDIKGKTTSEFCQRYHTLAAEQASALKAASLEERIAGIQAKLAHVGAAAATTSADPQASVLSKLTGIDLETVQIGMTLLVALLLEVGSGMGMYIAFSQWRINERHVPAAPRMSTIASQASVAPVAAPVVAVAAPPALVRPRSTANDNKTVRTTKHVAPESDVQRFYKERVVSEDTSSLTATELYEDYCAWCEQLKKEPLALPTFGRDFGELGIQKVKTTKGVRYSGIALRPTSMLEEVKNIPASGRVAA